VLEIESYFRPGVYADLLIAKISGLPSRSVSFFNKGMIFNKLVPYYHSVSVLVGYDRSAAPQDHQAPERSRYAPARDDLRTTTVSFSAAAQQCRQAPGTAAAINI
jgi:hypothetical protein